MTTQQIETFVKDTQPIAQAIRRGDVLIPEEGIPKHDQEVSDGYPLNYYRSDFDNAVKAREYLEHAVKAFVK